MSKYLYFELDEFLTSETAKSRNINNLPTFDVVDNLNTLTATILDPLRAAWGKPIKVTSGYRCPTLNRAVGGVPDSAHLYGLAADIQNTSGKFADFRDFVVKWLERSGAKFDQCLLESNSKGQKWIHLAVRNSRGQQRGQVKVLEVQ